MPIKYQLLEHGFFYAQWCKKQYTTLVYAPCLWLSLPKVAIFTHPQFSPPAFHARNAFIAFIITAMAGHNTLTTT